MAGGELRTNAAVTVDLVVLTVRGDDLVALVVERGVEPFRGHRALPGGFVLPDEDLPDAAARELQEETGLSAVPAHLEQLATYGAPGRDPRGRVVTVAHLALVADLPAPTAGSDAAGAAWLPVDDLLRDGSDGGDGGDGRGGRRGRGREGRGKGRDRLAFDHGRILADGVERARAKLEYSPLATSFCDDEFTVAELRRVYEVVWGTPLDPRNFHRKVTTTAGFLDATGRTTARDGGRPAQLFRRGPAATLHPPMLRPTPGRPPGSR